jgi:peptidoglycan-N-acetylglucosamine deacetylase
VRLASISVDLDEIPHYFDIHGLGPPPEGAAGLVYRVALGRLRDLAAAGGFPLTLFAIGRDLSREEARRGLFEAARAGDEIANHTLDHRYDLVRLGRDEIARQVREGAGAIEDAVGVRPSGFRAPGYTVSDELLDVLSELGVAYDASVFPCPPYFLAKAAALAAIALRGRTSRSILDRPAVLLSPTRPYRVGRPYWRRGSGLVEIPVQVTRGLRLPFIGTSVTLAGPSRAKLLARMCVGEPVVNLELHGIDVLDRDDGLGALAPHQPDVRVAHARKIDAILAAVGELKRAGYTFVTMREAARAVS